MQAVIIFPQPPGTVIHETEGAVEECEGVAFKDSQLILNVNLEPDRIGMRVRDQLTMSCAQAMSPKLHGARTALSFSVLRPCIKEGYR